MAAALDHLQGFGGSVSGSGPTTSTLTNAVSAGALLHVEVAAYSQSQTVTGGSVTDGTNTYTLTLDPVVANVDSGGTIALTILSCICTSGLSTSATLSITWSAGGVNPAAVEQGGLSATGIATSSYRDTSNYATWGTSSTWTRPLTTPTSSVPLWAKGASTVADRGRETR